MGLDTKTYWLTNRQSQCHSDSEDLLLNPAKSLLLNTDGYWMKILGGGGYFCIGWYKHGAIRKPAAYF
jgi:hypothetical protein